MPAHEDKRLAFTFGFQQFLGDPFVLATIHPLKHSGDMAVDNGVPSERETPHTDYRALRDQRVLLAISTGGNDLESILKSGCDGIVFICNAGSISSN